MLIQAVGGVALLAAMLTSTQADLSALQKDVGQLQDRVSSLLGMLEKEIPADIRQNEKISHLEKELDKVRDIIYKN